MNFLALEYNLISLYVLAMLVLKAAAFVSSLLYSAEAYSAAGKLTKPAWAAILGIGLVAQFLIGSGFFSLIFLIAALVYFADVRPALREVTGRR